MPEFLWHEGLDYQPARPYVQTIDDKFDFSFLEDYDDIDAVTQATQVLLYVLQLTMALHGSRSSDSSIQPTKKHLRIMESIDDMIVPVFSDGSNRRPQEVKQILYEILKVANDFFTNTSAQIEITHMIDEHPCEKNVPQHPGFRYILSD